MSLPEQVRQYLGKIGAKGGRIGGQSTSAAKLKAIAKNAKLGGRPAWEPSADERKLIRDLRKAGESVAAIAKKLDVSPHTLKKFLESL